MYQYGCSISIVPPPPPPNIDFMTDNLGKDPREAGGGGPDW